MSETRPMTLTQKILAQHAVGLTRPYVAPGDILQVKVDWTIASELAWNGMDRTYSLLGRPALSDKNRFFLAIDHTVDPDTLLKDKRTQKLAQLSRDFAQASGIKHFYDANETILHTKFYRELVQPGELILGADSHTSSHGGLGAFAIGLGGADNTASMVLGSTWIEVPEAIAVEYRGELPFGIGGKDVILRTLGLLGRNTVAMERTVEYVGDAVHLFSTDVRFTIANMTAELGGLNGIFEADRVVAEWLSRRKDYNDGARYFRADRDAQYLARYPVELKDLAPQVAKPFSPDNVKDLPAFEGTPLHGTFIGACTTTEEELVLGAMLLAVAMTDQKPVPTAPAKRLVVPGDRAIEKTLRDTGLLETYQKAGFVVDPPGCSMCLGVASRKADKGETWLSSQNRNFENRMGEGSFAWLASAATVAASSLGMKITDPRPLLARVDRAKLARYLGRDVARVVPEIRISEPEIRQGAHATASARASVAGGAPSKVVTGRVQRFGDGVDTDAIIPGQFCHLTKLEEVGEKAFHFVRPEFAARAKAGATIVVAGEGWGSGSSREHAVWALLGAGIQVIVAKSYAFIHKRNLVNEALPYLVVKDPAFYDQVAEGSELTIDLATGRITLTASGKSFQGEAPTAMVRRMTEEGGLVAAIKRHGPQVFDVLSG